MLPYYHLQYQLVGLSLLKLGPIYYLIAHFLSVSMVVILII